MTDNRAVLQRAYRQRIRAKAIAEGNVDTPRSERHTPGHHALAMSIVDQALADYFILVRAGAIKWREKSSWHSSRGPAREYCGMYEGDISALLAFLGPNGDAERVLSMLGVNFATGGIWEGLMRLEKTQQWRRLCNQGCHPRPQDGKTTEKC